ncbi:hypothetical protein J6590_000342 [Homalodisca vitripennis]|nr:hypothetical protein J6590_000342 [Homalodisca vitripennis]
MTLSYCNTVSCRFSLSRFSSVCIASGCRSSADCPTATGPGPWPRSPRRYESKLRAMNARASSRGMFLCSRTPNTYINNSTLYRTKYSDKVLTSITYSPVYIHTFPLML